MEWVGELHQRFGGKNKILISLEQRQVVQSLLQARRYEFDVERAVYLTVLHQLFASGSDRAAERWL